MKIIHSDGAGCELHSLKTIPTGIIKYPVGIIIYDEKIDLTHFLASYSDGTSYNFSTRTIFRYRFFPNELHKQIKSRNK